MAAFISILNGSWNDGATWGNTSPGVKGIDWPGLAGDTADMAHTVIYNVIETNEMGAVTVNSGGVLSALTSASTKLTLANVNLRINSGGELRWGTSSTRIGAAYTAEVLWNSTSDNAVGLYIESGAIVNIYGDPAYYGSNDESSLANNVENTNGNTIIITNDDMSALWSVGDELTIKIEDVGDSTSHTDAIVLGVIQSMSGTSITLDINITAAVGVGNTWNSPVVNVTRNVRLGKLSAFTAIGNYNTNRPLIYDINVSGNNNCVMDNVQVTGFYTLDSDYDFQFIDSIFRNGQYAINVGNSHTISGNIYSNSRGNNGGINHTLSANFYCNYYGSNGGSNSVFSGNLYSNRYAINSGTNHIVPGNLFSNQYALYYGTNHTISGNIYFNQYAVYYGTGFVLSGKLGYDFADVSKPNTSADFYYSGFTEHILKAVKLPLGGLVFASRGGSSERGGIYSEDHNQVVGASHSYLSHGDIIKNTTVVRSGGADNSIEVVPMSTADMNNPINIFEWVEFNVPSSTQVRSVYVRGEGMSVFPNASQLYFEAEYLDAASGVTKAVVSSTDVLVDNVTWVQFSVNFTPGQLTLVRYRMFLKAYASGVKVYVDNRLN